VLSPNLTRGYGEFELDSAAGLVKISIVATAVLFSPFVEPYITYRRISAYNLDSDIPLR